MNTFLNIYIIKRFKKLNKSIPSNKSAILKNWISKYNEDKIKVKFSYFIPMERNKILGVLSINNTIYLSAEAATQIILNSEDSTAYKAALFSLGHEIGHIMKNFKKDCLHNTKLNKQDKKFIKYIDEVYSDFYAIKSKLNNSRTDAIDAVNYKIKERVLHKRYIDRSDETHPGWFLRKQFIKHYNFNLDLINEIALISGCTNSSLIQKIFQYYGNIFIK